MTTWRKALLPSNAILQDAIGNLNESSLQIALVVDADGVFQGSITDGDIRRSLLRGLHLNSPIDSIIQRDAFVAPPDMSRGAIKCVSSSGKKYHL